MRGRRRLEKPTHDVTRLNDLGVLLAKQEIDHAKQMLVDVHARHAANAQARQDAADEAERMQRLLEARAERIRLRHEAAARIQKWWRLSLLFGATVEPMVRALQQKVLAIRKAKLKDELLGLRHAVHALQVSANEQDRCSRVIQAWWRRVLAMRVMEVGRVYWKLKWVRDELLRAVLKIQGSYRQKMARRRINSLRLMMQIRAEQAELAYEEAKTKAAIKIQSFYRRTHAQREVQARRDFIFSQVQLMYNDDPFSAAAKSPNKATQKVAPKVLSAFSGGGAGSKKAKATPRRKKPVSDLK